VTVVRGAWRFSPALQAWADPLTAVALTGWAAGSLAVAGQLDAVPGSLCVLAFCALAALRSWRPLPVVLLASVLIALPAFTHNLATVNDDAVFVSLWLATILYSFTLGTRCSWAVAVVGIAGLVAGVNLSSSSFNPVPEMLIAGPWLAGLLVASRRRAAHQLAQRARELDDEREAYSAESVRYERARIARELHDIVAHCVSLMVVQASAGEKLAATDPQRAGESFTSISEAARQARDEISLLVQLLAESPPAARSADLRIVEELVTRAQSSGLSITCELTGDLGGLSEASADTAYRLVQEALTNALKHAPGAPVHITLSGQADQVRVQIVNDPPRAGSSGLERTGGGHGLAGMRERISHCGGTLTTASTVGGGWNVTGAFPRGSSLSPQRPLTSPGSQTGWPA
jgi:signal transduction histidine kinase